MMKGAGMRSTVAIVIVGLVSVLAGAVESQQQSPEEMSWAFPAKVEMNRPPAPETPGPKTLPRSSKRYTQEQIDDLATPPDWFPEEHGQVPRIVADGTANKGFACGSCHLMSGYGHPESSDLVGLPAAYIIQQMADFKSGARKEPIRMNAIAQATSDEDVKEAAAWFAGLKPSATPFIRVEETESVPKTYLGPGRMRFVQPEGGTEPIGKRIIMVPEDAARVRLRDPHSGFMAYVPAGSMARGKELVETGGSGVTTSCTICHDDSLNGLGNVPRIAGHHPIYTVRQLHRFKDGSRAGRDAEPMRSVVEKLTDDDIIAISAYLGSVR